MEREIVEAARAGDPAAFSAVVDEFTPTVLAAAYGWCGDRHLAADIAQEVFTTAYLKIGELREPAALPGWLMAITRRTAQRAARRADLPLTADVASVHVEDDVVAADEARVVRKAVEALPAAQRIPVVLHYFAGHSLADISVLCGVPLSTVKKRMRDARARLRRGGTHMTERTLGRVVTDPEREDARDVVRIFTALRTGDPALVAALLDVRPDLVHVREDWTREESRRHRLPWTRGGGTPLLRAVERSDVAMVALLLDRGADPDGACGCDGRENPAWVATAQRDLPVLDLLLAHGADPNRPAFAGLTPLDVATVRGFDDVAARLRAAGATSSTTVPFDGPATTPTAGSATGIKVLDLWCPLPRQGLVHMEFGYGLGAIVLLCELARRAAVRGTAVVWAGFVPRPLDLGDFHHALADGGVSDAVDLVLAAPTASPASQRATFTAALSVAPAGALVVVFAEVGFRDAVDERLFDLAQRDGVTIVVSPLEGEPELPRPGTGPYVASIVFDRRRAHAGRWPAVGPESWSTVASPEVADLAARARLALTDELDAYLCQPFHVAEHVIAEPGESVSLDQLIADVTRLVDDAEQAAIASGSR